MTTLPTTLAAISTLWSFTWLLSGNLHITLGLLSHISSALTTLPPNFLVVVHSCGVSPKISEERK